mgnify:CR=1 FL=1
MFFMIIFLKGAKFTILMPLSLLCICKFLFPLSGLKIFSFDIFSAKLKNSPLFSEQKIYILNLAF